MCVSKSNCCNQLQCKFLREVTISQVYFNNTIGWKPIQSTDQLSYLHYNAIFSMLSWDLNGH